MIESNKTQQKFSESWQQMKSGNSLQIGDNLLETWNFDHVIEFGWIYN